jgi:hypothetical protein
MLAERAGLCRYHHPRLKQATIARNTAAIRAYWAAYKAARAVADALKAEGGMVTAADEKDA